MQKQNSIQIATEILKEHYTDINYQTLKEKLEPKKEPQLLKVKDTAKILALSTVHISRLIKKGELQGVNVGLEKILYRVTMNSIEEFIKRRTANNMYTK